MVASIGQLLRGSRAAGSAVIYTTVVYDEAGKQTAAAFSDYRPIVPREAVGDRDGDAHEASPGSSIRVDPDSGAVEVDGPRFQAEPLHPFVREIAGAGGLVAWARDEVEGAR